jgi:hypothetical protein
MGTAVAGPPRRSASASGHNRLRSRLRHLAQASRVPGAIESIRCAEFIKVV